MIDSSNIEQISKELALNEAVTAAILLYKEQYRSLLYRSKESNVVSLCMAERVVNDVKSFLSNVDIVLNTNDTLRDSFNEFLCNSNFYKTFDEYLTLMLSYGEAFMYLVKEDGKIKFAAASLFSTLPSKMTNNTFDEIYVVSGDSKQTFYTKLGLDGLHETYLKKIPLAEWGRKDSQVNQVTNINTDEKLNEEWAVPCQFVYNSTNIRYQDYISTPFGKSLFWNVNLFMKADEAYLLWRKELQFSEKMIALDKTQARTMAADTKSFNRTFNKENYPNNNGYDQSVAITDSDSKLGNVFKVMNIGKDIIKEFSTAIRPEYMDAIRLDMKLIGLSANLGPDFYEVDNAVRDGAQTAFEVRMKANSQFNKFITNLRNDIACSMKNILTTAIVEACLIEQLDPALMYVNYNDLAFNYPEIYEDALSKREYLNDLCNRKIISKKMLLMQAYSMSEQDAIQAIYEANIEKALDVMAMTDPTIWLEEPQYGVVDKDE